SLPQDRSDHWNDAVGSHGARPQAIRDDMDVLSTNSEILAVDRDLQPPLYTKRDIALARGEGVILWDAEGNSYLDAMSNYGVNVLGHAHPAVTEAISSQAATLISCHQS